MASLWVSSVVRCNATVSSTRVCSAPATTSGAHPRVASAPHSFTITAAASTFTVPSSRAAPTAGNGAGPSPPPRSIAPRSRCPSSTRALDSRADAPVTFATSFTGLVKFNDRLSPSSPSSLRDRTPTSPATRTCAADTTRPTASNAAITSSKPSSESPPSPTPTMPATSRRSVTISRSRAAEVILIFYHQSMTKARISEHAFDRSGTARARRDPSVSPV